ncbi:SDR family NAD(P)-dependent oxidoreductase [Sphingomonas sanxanigenens]|uniref:Short-chain dehydrogenase n=1 Tax=Sphingomonas sanxanigenens DSM 19645 = NX02 TaxID=1123269 RepID=W0AAW4_9SPHN|nr:SDR family NAD(P)-dependent oxidoreductase [Sphingomonas sanxanigenens]AHE54246.1 short-chain dehydrogenase [Sphingomonas sanxanigenens DSM 19645 = NX02]
MSNDNRKVAVVTGASRGAGAGIARALGAAGYAVYVTGRTTVEGSAPLPGTIGGTARAIDEAGGRGIAVAVDHRDDSAVKALFGQIERDEGRLDILVNNAAIIDDALIQPGGFWERPLSLVDILDVGLRSGYVASFHAAPLMIRTGGGLIAFTSSFGSACYMHGPAYGAQKAGVDKFAADMGVDLKEADVAAVSIWMGPLKTERTDKAIAERPDQYEAIMANAETPEFTGRVIAAIHADPDRMALTGQTLIGAEMGERYGIVDAGDKQPPSFRAMLGEPRIPHPAIVR